MDRLEMYAGRFPFACTLVGRPAGVVFSDLGWVQCEKPFSPIQVLMSCESYGILFIEYMFDLHIFIRKFR